MVGWHHWLNGHVFEQALGVGSWQGILVCCNPWGCKKLNPTEQLNWLIGLSLLSSKEQASFNFVDAVTIHNDFGARENKICHEVMGLLGFPCGSAGKEPACNVENLGSILGLGRSPPLHYPLQYFGLENSMDCIAHGVAKRHNWVTFTSPQGNCMPRSLFFFFLYNLSFLNVEFQATFFTLLFHPHQTAL